MRICYVFPSRERPQKFFAALDNIRGMSENKDYFICAKLDEDDPSMNNEDIKAELKEYPEVIIKWGLSRNKVHAINRDLDNIPEYDILCTHSDDMVFIKYGFDEDIREAFKDWEGLVHFPDQIAKDSLITYSMMHKNYYNKLGYIYHPDFNSVYCDNYQHLQAKAKGKYRFVNKKILEHHHPIWGFGQKDELLIRTEDPVNYQIDRKTFDRLKATNLWI